MYFQEVRIESISQNSYHQRVLREAKRAGATIELAPNGVIRITPRHEQDSPLFIRAEGLPWLGNVIGGGRK